jgi:hypothetical protein
MTNPRELGPDQALDALLDEAKAGASDQWLADKADVSVRQVQLWRKARGLSVDKGPVQQAIGALQGLSQGYEPSVHMTSTTVDFDTPQFVLREPLDYTQYARLCHTLRDSYAFTLKQIAHGTGTRINDVEKAIELWVRWLGTQGAKCLGCDALVDPRFQKECSRSCYDRAISR